MTSQTIPLESNQGIILDRIGGDVRLEGWDRQELQARGDVIQVERRADVVVISCAGDLALSLPAHARLTINSIGGDLRLQGVDGAVDVGLVGGDAVLSNLPGPVQLRDRIGGVLRLDNVSNLSMDSQGAGERFHSADVARRKVERAARHADASLRSAQVRIQRTSDGHMDDRIERANRQVARATRQAQAALRRAQVSVQEMSSGGSQPESGGHGDSASASTEGVSEEERMVILRMLQDHKITSEQAEKLLAALEGNS